MRKMFFHTCFIPFSLLVLIIFQGSLIYAQKKTDFRPPKNVIIMIGDGMSYNQIRSSAYYFGKKKLGFEEFPVQVAMATYPAKGGEYREGVPGSNYFSTGYNTVAAWKDTSYLKSNYTESAAAATALATGYKTYNNAIGLSVGYDTLENLVELAKSLNKSAGVVTSVEFSHATPAGFVAHNKTRINNSQIAFQMLLESRCDVIMGCGDPSYDNNGNPTKERWSSSRYVGDSTFWSQLIAGSGRKTSFKVGLKTFEVKDSDGDGISDPWVVVRDRKDFVSLMKGATPKRVLGCPKVNTTLQFARSVSPNETENTPPFFTPFNPTVPTLAEMSLGAINVLDGNKNGFFAMIEGGAIDWACHGNSKGRMIEEMKSFNDAVDTVIQWINKFSNWEETLLIVTGDHETGMLWGNEPFIAITDNGPDVLPGMKFYSDDHTNSLIGVFAKGGGSDWLLRMADEYDSLRGPFIQNTEIPLLVRFLWTR